jgi:23S rRNA pseudouridine2605 synthase
MPGCGRVQLGPALQQAAPLHQMLERLQKIISAAGLASRRNAEAIILQGLVSVNGRTVTELGSKADSQHDKIRVGGKLLRAPGRRAYVLLHKPVGYVSTLSDPEERPTIAALLRESGFKERVYPVGRLDYNSSGLVLMTNDGDFANLLMSRNTAVPRTYHVKLDGCPDDRDLKKLEAGIVLDGRKTAPASVRTLGERSHRQKPWYEITLVEGRYHQVRRMFERIGQPVVKLKRVRIAFLTDSGLKPGQWRLLTKAEVDRLKSWKPERADRPSQRRSNRRSIGEHD